MPPAILLGSALVVLLVGIFSQTLLLILFPLLAFNIGRNQFQYWMNAPKGKMHWWYQHMSGMFIACIATVTAFLVTALPRIWPNDFTKSPVLWIAPGVILGSILSKWVKRYQIQFGDS